MPSSRAGLADLPASQARDEIARGAFKAVEIAQACLERIAEREPAVQAFEHLDIDYVMKQAEAADRYRATGRTTGPLHGVPVGVKDIIDTRDLPTENGTVFDKGRRPVNDAAVVVRLREAGAIILGKTVTTELAAFTPGKTRNPHDTSRTPGGSSSGSAAAVAAYMTPLAIGTQTNGSVIRPASFCGVVGFKPTRGSISRRGILPQSSTLDQVGTFSRTIEDAALFVEALCGYDDRDSAMSATARPDLFAIATAKPPVRPTLAFVRTPVWGRASEEVREGFGELIAAMSGNIDEIELPEPFSQAHAWHRAINMAELAKSYAHYYDRDATLLSESMRGMVEEGREVPAVDYLAALDGIAVLNAGLERLFDRYDAILTPAAPGEAPVGMATGDPAFSTIWTYCGVPALTLPLLTGPNGMPVGVQLVGRRFHDGRLLRTARWLEAALREDAARVKAHEGAIA